MKKDNKIKERLESLLDKEVDAEEEKKLKALGCEILPYDDRFPDVERWQVLDNLDAAKLLQTKLDEIDGERT